MKNGLFYKVVVILMVISALSVLILSRARLDGPVRILEITFLVFIAFNAICIRLSARGKLKFLQRPGFARRLFRVVACTPLLIFVATLIGDFTMRRNPLYENALQRLQNSPVGMRDLGQFRGVGWPVGGNLEEFSKSGKINLIIPVFGRQGAGTLQVRGTKSNGVWSAEEVLLSVQGGSIRERIEENHPHPESGLPDAPSGAGL